MKTSRTIALKPGTLLFRSILTGTVGGAAICALLLLLAAAAVQSSGQLPQDLLQPMILIISAVSAFFAGLFAGKVSHRRGLLLGMGCGMLLFLLCLIGGAVNSHDVLSISSLTRMMVMVLSGALGGYLAIYRRSKIR
ncbi:MULTISPECIES: TIGR04086 family membrane protein [Caproicibacterium]|nr:TIGR04086 family membrane protein [Caproicibacterium lactatifermentans]